MNFLRGELCRHCFSCKSTCSGAIEPEEVVDGFLQTLHTNQMLKFLEKLTLVLNVPEKVILKNSLVIATKPLVVGIEPVGVGI